MSEQTTTPTQVQINPTNRLRTFLYASSIVGILIVYLLGFLVIYWLMFPYKVIEYRTTPLPVLQTFPEDVNNIPPERGVAVFRPGDTIYVIHDFCKYLDVRVEADIELVDGVRLSFPPTSNHGTVGCSRRVSQTFQIPTLFKSNEMVKIHYTLHYKVNPIRTVTYHLESEPFMVVDDTQAKTE